MNESHYVSTISVSEAGAEAPVAPPRETSRNNSTSLRGGRTRGRRRGRGVSVRTNAGRGRNTVRHRQPEDNSDRRGEPIATASQHNTSNQDEPHRNQHHHHDQQHHREQERDEHNHHRASRRRGNSKRGRGRWGTRRGDIGGGRGRTAGQAVSAAKQEPEDEERPLCIVCAEELIYFAVGECNHPGRCAKCAMRSRMLLKDRSCPECKTILERLVVAKMPGDGVPPRFESFNIWGDFAGPDAKLDEGSEMIFHSCASHLEHLVRARELRCPVGACYKAGVTMDGDSVGGTSGCKGGQAFDTKEALLEHMKSVHQRFFCGVCLESRPLFFSEHEVFHGAAALRKHESRPDGGHPLCRFCSRRFFDNAALYEHMTGTHINCHLCPEEHQQRYFRGEPQLRDHLRTRHLLCDHEECRQQGVVSAFNTPVEFQAHLVEEHGIIAATDRRGAAAVGFTIRRAARDGSGLGGAAPRHDASQVDDLSEGVIVVAPTPSTRGGDTGITSLGRLGNPMGGLGGGSGSSGGGAGGWGEALRRSSPLDPEEAFPSLPTASSSPRPAYDRHEFSLVGRRRGPDRTGLGAGANGPAKEIQAGKDDEKRVLLRNKRLAEALGIRAALGAGAAIGGAKVGTTAEGATVAMGIGGGLDVIREHLERTNYSTFLVSWARMNRSELLKLERRLAELVADRRGTSTQLKPMAAEDRKAVHELAGHYGLVTQSYHMKHKRYVSAIKQQGCRIPTRLLSVAARDPGYKGTDEVPPDALPSTVGIDPVGLRSAGGTLSSSLSALPSSCLASPLSPSHPTPSTRNPGAARVTSISSSTNLPASRSREAAGDASGKASAQLKKDGQGKRQGRAVATSTPYLHSNPKNKHKQSKWGNSVIKGRLSRPSDGRVPTVEREANERKESREKLRRLEEARRERIQKRDAEKLDAHASVWENLAESFSEEEKYPSSSPEDQESPRAADPPRRDWSVPEQQEQVGGRESTSLPPLRGGSWESDTAAAAHEANGWACGRCTFWNDFEAEGGNRGLPSTRGRGKRRAHGTTATASNDRPCVENLVELKLADGRAHARLRVLPNGVKRVCGSVGRLPATQ